MLPTPWVTALDQFHDQLRQRKYAPSTAARLVKQVATFARSTGQPDPWGTTRADCADWLDTHPKTPASTYAYRTTLRTFYRWAYEAGRMPTNPMEDNAKPGPDRRTAPPQWEAALVQFARYLRAAGHSRNTINDRVYQLTRLGRELGNPNPWAVDPGDLIDWLARHKWARETARSARQAVRGFYRWGFALGHNDCDPSEAIPRIKASQPVPRPASEEAYKQALHAAPDETTRLMLRLAAETGLRRAEVARVHTSDIETDSLGAWLWVRGKGDKVRRVPLPDDLARHIQRRPIGYLFPSQRAPHLTPGHVGKTVTRLLPEGVTMHALRHRFATRAYAKTRDVFALQDVLGHANPATTRQYVRSDPRAARALVEE